MGSGSAVFFIESGIKFLRVQGSKFSSFLGSGIKILGKNMESVTKKYTSFRPCAEVALIDITAMISKLNSFHSRSSNVRH